MSEDLRWFLPDTMTMEQEKVLSSVSDRLKSYKWSKKFITAWWQTPDKNLNGFCPLEALCMDRFDLVHMSLDKTVRIYESKVKKIEEERKRVKDLLKNNQ